MKCPACSYENKDHAEVAMHLTDEHEYSFDEAMDWLRSVEEAKEAL